MTIPSRPRISVCIPHWQAEIYMKLCLRAIREYSTAYDLEVIVVDNGSRDGSLDYLRSLPWLRLIERPEEGPGNWPTNVFTAWDRGLSVATGELYLTMHSDVFVRSDRWLDPFLREMAAGPHVAATGAWKLELEHPFMTWQKQATGYMAGRVKRLFGSQKAVAWQKHDYPRDYCALYRRQVLLDGGMSFRLIKGLGGGGASIAGQIRSAGYEMRVFPVHEMGRHLFHVAHGTAAIAPEKRLRHARKQAQTERKVARLMRSDWIETLRRDATLDAA